MNQSPSLLLRFGILLPLLLGGLSATAAAYEDPGEEPAVKAIREVMPAVVNIQAERSVEQPFKAYDAFFRRFYYGTRSVPVQSLGSGLLISVDGYVVTNYHVVAQAGELAKIQVTLSNRNTYAAQYVRGDERADLAIIRIESDEQFPYFDLSKVSPNHLGQTVIALGNPVGYQNSVSRGILSAVNRRLESENGVMEGLLQTDAAINPGNSGGPLIDVNGHLVGLNSAKFAGEAIEGIGFAIPGVRVAAWVAEAIAIARGQKPAPEPVSLLAVLKARFGLDLAEITPQLVRTYGFRTGSGLVIRDVENGSPAALAGLQPGMLIVEIGNIQIYDESSLPREIESIKTGEPIGFSVVVVENRGRYFRQRANRVNLVAR